MNLRGYGTAAILVGAGAPIPAQSAIFAADGVCGDLFRDPSGNVTQDALLAGDVLSMAGGAKAGGSGAAVGTA